MTVLFVLCGHDFTVENELSTVNFLLTSFIKGFSTILQIYFNFNLIVTTIYNSYL